MAGLTTSLTHTHDLITLSTDTVLDIGSLAMSWRQLSLGAAGGVAIITLSWLWWRHRPPGPPIHNSPPLLATPSEAPVEDNGTAPSPEDNAAAEASPKASAAEIMAEDAAPERTAVVARRMIFAHLGLKLSQEQRQEEREFWKRKSQAKGKWIWSLLKDDSQVRHRLEHGASWGMIWDGIPASGDGEWGDDLLWVESWIKTYSLYTSDIWPIFGPQDILRKTYPISWVKSACSSASGFEKAYKWAPFFYSLSCTFTRQQLCRYRCYVSMVELNQMGRMHQIGIGGKRVEKRKFMGCRVWGKFQGCISQFAQGWTCDVALNLASLEQNVVTSRIVVTSYNL